jgi:hypothetical protein
VFFRLSKIEKPLIFLSLDSLNKCRKTHMGSNQSFLGFVKHTPRDSSKGGSYINKHMLSSLSLRKNKEVLARNGGGKLGKKRVSVFVLVVVIVSLEHDTPLHHCIRVGNPFVSRLTSHKSICWVLIESMLPRPLSCHSYVQDKSNLNEPSIEWPICSYKFSTMSAFPVSVSNHFIL